MALIYGVDFGFVCSQSLVGGCTICQSSPKLWFRSGRSDGITFPYCELHIPDLLKIWLRDWYTW